METQLEAAVRTAVTFLETHGHRYALIGGLALPQWGVVRTTYDVNLKVLVPDSDYAGMQNILRTAFSENAPPARPPHPLIVSVTIGQVIVDFLLALPGYEELIIERAVRRKLRGFSVWIATAEDLIIQNQETGRGRPG